MDASLIAAKSPDTLYIYTKFQLYSSFQSRDIHA